MLKAMKADCKERIQDSRSTHFQFGLDVEPKNTEQVQKARSNVPTVRVISVETSLNRMLSFLTIVNLYHRQQFAFKQALSMRCLCSNIRE